MIQGGDIDVTGFVLGRGTISLTLIVIEWKLN